MKTNNNKATPRVYHTLRQIVQRIPRWLIEKAAAKMHTRLSVGSFIPSVVCVEAGKPHDSTMADELTKDMKGQALLYHVELLRNSDG